MIDDLTRIISNDYAMHLLRPKHQTCDDVDCTGRSVVDRWTPHSIHGGASPVEAIKVATRGWREVSHSLTESKTKANHPGKPLGKPSPQSKPILESQLQLAS
eukprot:GHVU01135826.1.p1 GENE.GHVU01135826.1~~GHVU01135826.1.p1  ORF type:complete len:102 (+),score=3.51 GHVU01135826.1:347-652(+)